MNTITLPKTVISSNLSLEEIATIVVICFIPYMKDEEITYWTNHHQIKESITSLMQKKIIQPQEDKSSIEIIL